MKFGLVVSTQDALPSAYVVFRDELGRCIERCAELGYDGVELALRTRAQADVNRLRERLTATGLTIPCISTGQIFAADNLYFTHSDAEVRQEAVARVVDMICLAAEFGAKVNVGRVRGLIQANADPRETRQHYLECVHQCAEIAEPLGVELLVEPVNRYEVNFVNSCVEGAEIIQQTGRSCLRLMPDTFHMNIEDVSFRRSLVETRDLVSYIHVADSNRLAPGWGHLPFHEVFDTLREIGYDGWITAEVLPLPDPDHAARQAITYLREHLAGATESSADEPAISTLAD